MFLLRMVNSRCRSVSRYCLSGPIAAVPMTNERICDLALQRISVRLNDVCVYMDACSHACVYVLKRLFHHLAFVMT